MSEPQKKKKFSESFISWVNGEWEPKDQNLFIMECQMSRRNNPADEYQKRDRRRLRQFLGFYPLAATLICLVLVAILMNVVLSMPTFGQPNNPINNEVSEHYLEYTEEETGSINAVTGMILTYRGFDTLGESCVLFLAVACVMILLERDEKNTDHHDLQKLEQEDAIERTHKDIITRHAAKILIPFIFLFAFYVLRYGETSPGGGFSGGTILGGALIFFSSTFGFERTQLFFNKRVYDRIRTFGLMLYALLYGYNIFVGANKLKDPLLPFIHGLSMPIDIAVGLVVACTVYGFYAMFTRGEL